MACHERRRNGLDDDELSSQKQILPVANLPKDFDSPPVDGMQYLFTVRRDARCLPHTTRVANPYQGSSPLACQVDSSAMPKYVKLPCEEWRRIFEMRFKNFRRKMQGRTTMHVATNHQRFFPEKKERGLWWAYLCGKPRSEWEKPPKPTESRIIPHSLEKGPDSPSAFSNVHVVPREPLPFLLHHIDQQMALHLLMYFSHWINIYVKEGNYIFRPLEAHARWIFVLLSKIGDPLSADEMSLMRNLARACIDLLKFLLQRQKQNNGTEHDNATLMSVQSCWIIFSTIADVWVQRDLWQDADEGLRSLDS